MATRGKEMVYLPKAASCHLERKKKPCKVQQEVCPETCD